MDEREWYHCTTHTYGARLPGDPRGFRTRHHVEHVEGDYKSPPPAGIYTERHAESKRLMKQEAVAIPADLRKFVARTIADKLRSHGALVLAVSVSSTHVHLLAKMPPGEVPRKWLGSAKRQATFALKERGWVGELWATRSKIGPVKDRGHQLKTLAYICRHRDEGAWVWDFRDEDQPQE